MSICIVPATNRSVHVVVSVMDLTPGAERAVVVMVMVGIAMMPVPVMCPTAVNVPPSRVIPPVPGAVPCYPCRAPKPVVDNRSVYIYRLDDIARTVYVLVSDDLHFHIVLRFVFLYVYRGHILVDILCQDRLQYNQSSASFTSLYHAQIVHLTVAVQIQVTERTVRVVQHRLKLFQVLRLSK